MVEKTGSATSSQRPVALEVKQHESVPFSVLPRQKLHKPMRLSPNPQSWGSFASPMTQFPLIEFAGNAQFVKSARSWSAKSLFFPAHRSLETISSSLRARSAQESAHSGIESAPVNPQGCLEFCMIPLQRKLRVYRA